MAIQPDQKILEIGPGRGALTRHLVALSNEVAAIELDRDLIAALQFEFPQLRLVSGDVLRVDLQQFFELGQWRLVGNLPYNIASQLIIRLLDYLDHISDMHFMVQREMGERLSAVPGTKAWGRLGILVQLYCDVEYVFEVAPESFLPPPKVWSQIVRLRPKSQVLPVTDLKEFTRLLSFAFNQRRKTLRNSLKPAAISWQEVNVNPTQRADDTSLEEFVMLANYVSERTN